MLEVPAGRIPLLWTVLLPAATVAVSLLCAASAYAATTFTQTLVMPNNNFGLVGHWTFDGKDMINNVRDSSGQGDNGGLEGYTSTTTVPGVIGQALQFSGTNQEVSIPDNVTGPVIDLQTLSEFSISVWEKELGNTSGGGVDQFFVAKGNNTFGATTYTYELGTENDGTATFSLYDGTNNPSATASTALFKWHHIVSVYKQSDNTTALKLYVDGQLSATANRGSYTTAANTSDPVLFSEWPHQSTNGRFNGALDDVRIYNRPLSAAEVTQLYNQAVGTHQNTTVNPPNLQSGLVGHWTFDGKDMIRNVADTSGLGNNGVLVAAATSSQQVAGTLGQALKLDGTTQYVYSSPIDLSSLTDASISFWMKPQSTINSSTVETGLIWINGSLQEVGEYSDMSFNIGGVGADGKLLTDVKLDAQGDQFVSSSKASWTGGTWYHIVVEAGSSGRKIYVNGALDTNDPASTAQINQMTALGENVTSADLTIGGENFTGSFGAGFPGSIDDFRIYNRALSAAEVNQLYNGGAGSHQNTTLTPPNLQSGLVGHWTFDGKDMIRNVADTSGQGSTGYLTNYTSTTTAPGAIGQGLLFNGVNNYVNVPTVNYSNNVTVAAWVKSNVKISTDQEQVFDSGSDAKIIMFADCTSFACASEFAIQNTVATYFTAYNSQVLNSNQWYLLVGTLDGSNVRFYVNGVEGNHSPTAFSGTPKDAAQNFAHIGIHQNGTSHPFNGVIDDVRVYNRALSAAEVLQLYKLGR